MPARKTVWLKLERNDQRCSGTCWDSESDQRLPLPKLKLAPDDVIKIPNNHPPHDEVEYSTRALLQALVGFDEEDLHVAFEERGQVSLGQHLWNETLGRIERFKGAADVDLRIVTDDEHLGRLPWPLLARRGLFVVNSGWTVSLVGTLESLPDVELPPSPKLLMVIPQPAEWDETEGAEHRDELKRLLESVAPRMADPDHFHVVATWDEYLRETGRNRYDVVYYYGHGEGTETESRLVFENDGKQPRPTPLRDFAERLRGMKPKLVYVNCCSGDAGGLLGAGRQLADVTPCVVTNRTLASVAAARAQAVTFWRAVLLNGVDPRVAVGTNYQSLGALNLNSASPHWFTPTIHANYDGWRSNPPKRSPVPIVNPRLTLDRTDQFGHVLMKTQDVLRDRRPRCLAFLWYGEEDQGMKDFHDRLERELPSRLPNATLVSRMTRWPDRDSVKGERRFSRRACIEMLLEAFDVHDLEQIGGQVRREAHDDSAIVVVNHPHVTSSQMMDPVRLMEYLHWWNDDVVPRLHDDQHFYLLGFSFRTKRKHVEKFRSSLTQCGYDGLALKQVRVSLLPPLESIKRHELLDYLQQHDFDVPLRLREQVLDYILQRTEGRYEAMVLELERLIRDGVDAAAIHESDQPDDPSSDPFGMDE